jgi:hypothetical protein
MIAARAPFITYQLRSDVIVSYYIPGRFQSIGGGLWIGARRPGLWGFTAKFWSQWNWVIQAPYWFAVMSTAAIATVPWLRWRFGLRTLLIATTLIAFGFGTIAVAFQ